jgi:4-nitrophenyl phosphatase
LSEDRHVLGLDQARGFVLDMDGVLYRGDEPLPGLGAFVETARRRGVPFVFVTNNSMRTVAQYVAKLAEMGVTVAPDRIITSGSAVAEYLVEHYAPGTRVYVLGMPALEQVVVNAETGFVLDTATPEVVVSGSDFTLTYEKLKIATLAIRRGAAWVATNPDTTLPVEDGLWPGAGAILAALRAATDAEPLVVGKPEPVMMQLALRRMGLPASQAIMVGDRLDTDILGGIRAGMTTALVLTGVETPTTLAKQSIRPDYVFRDLAELVERAWGGAPTGRR